MPLLLAASCLPTTAFSIVQANKHQQTNVSFDVKTKFHNQGIHAVLGEQTQGCPFLRTRGTRGTRVESSHVLGISASHGTSQNELEVCDGGADGLWRGKDQSVSGHKWIQLD